MSAAVGAKEIGEVARQLHVDQAEEWCEARGVDPQALVELGENQTQACLLAIGRCELTPPEAFANVAILCFQAGVEVERRRRDKELPS